MSDTYVTHPEDTHEMGKVREIFDRAMNALLTSTELAKTVEQLKTDLDSLRVQVNAYRNTIANQDDQITRLRNDRDAARTAQYQAEDKARHMENDLSNIKRDNEAFTSANSRLNERITELTHERDDAGMKILELEDHLSKLTKKFDNIRAALGIVEEPKPEPLNTLTTEEHAEPEAGPWVDNPPIQEAPVEPKWT